VIDAADELFQRFIKGGFQQLVDGECPVARRK